MRYIYIICERRKIAAILISRIASWNKIFIALNNNGRLRPIYHDRGCVRVSDAQHWWHIIWTSEEKEHSHLSKQQWK